MGTEGEANEKIRFQDRVIEIQREEVGRLGDRVRDLKSALVWHKERLDAYKSANEALKETARQRRDRIMELESTVSRYVEEYRRRIEALEKRAGNDYRLRDKNTRLEMAITKALEIAREEG